jgi:hypothetical protein
MHLFSSERAFLIWVIIERYVIEILRFAQNDRNSDLNARNADLNDRKRTLYVTLTGAKGLKRTLTITAFYFFIGLQ